MKEGLVKLPQKAIILSPRMDTDGEEEEERNGGERGGEKEVERYGKTLACA